MDRRMSADLDRHITGNYGEDQLREGERADGVYHVRDRRYGWTIAKWNSAQSWWVLAWPDMSDPAYPSGCCGDARFLEIGERIQSPKLVVVVAK